MTIDLRQGVCVLGLVLLFGNGVVFPLSSSAQETTPSSSALAEGYALHRPTDTFYYYRVHGDSTVYLRKGRSPSRDSTLRIPAHTLTAIHWRIENEILPSESERERFAFGYEDNYLILDFTQRFDLYVLGALILTLLIGGILVLWLRRRLLQEQRERAALARSRQYLAEGREEERRRLAKEIHDGPVQDLHGLHMQLNAATDSIEPERIEEVGRELMRVTSELRAMSADLHPPALEKFGLAAALRSHADRLESRHPDLDLQTDLSDSCDDLPDDYALSLFRLAQEAVNNAVQHGSAGSVQVRLRCDRRDVNLAIVDDGTGFSPPENRHTLAEDNHYGLLGMWERAEAMDAVLTIDSAPGEGTRVELHGSIESRSQTAGRTVSVPA